MTSTCCRTFLFLELEALLAVLFQLDVARLHWLEVVPILDISDVCHGLYVYASDEFIQGSFQADNAGFAVVEAQYVNASY